MVYRFRVLTVILALCALPFLASSARAADYCVGAAPGCVGTDEGSDLQKALDDAQAHSGNDRVLIGPGTYSHSGGFTYSDNNSTNTIEVRGAGTPRPTLTMTGPFTSQGSVLDVTAFPATVADLDVVIPADTGGNHGLHGITVGTTNSAVSGVTVTDTPGADDQQVGVQMASGTLSDSTISLYNGSVGAYIVANGDATVTHATITAGRGIDWSQSIGSTGTFRRSRLSTSFRGLYIYRGHVVAEDSLIDLQGAANTIGLEAFTVPSTGSTVDAHRLTIRNGGANSIGVSTYNYNAQSVTVDLRQSIVWDVAFGLKVSSGVAGASSTVSWGADDLVAANKPADNAGGGTATYQPDALQPSVSTDPLFVAPVSGVGGVGGDYRLRHDSPLVDLGDATLSSGEQDLGGHDRVVDGDGNGSGLADYGAFEYQRSAPVAVATSPTAMPVNPGDTVAFDASGSSDPDGEDISFAWQFDDGASATGAQPSHAFATGGAHSGIVTVTDTTGRSASANVDVTVATPPSGGSDGGTTGGTPSGSDGGTTTGATGTPEPAVVIHGGRVRLDARGRAAVRLTCPTARTTHCRGTLVLRRKKLVLGRARYDLAAGTTARRRVSIGRAGRRLLGTRPRITATARTIGAHASLTLLRARRS